MQILERPAVGKIK